MTDWGNCPKCGNRYSAWTKKHGYLCWICIRREQEEKGEEAERQIDD